MFSKMIKSLWLTLSVVLIATSVSARVTPMPDYMKILGANSDDTACWQAFDGFMSSGNTDYLPMIFTTEESKVVGRSGSPMCKSRLFALREKIPEISKEVVDAANAEIREKRAAFREKLVGMAQTGDPIAQKYVREAIGKFPGFQRSEIDVAALKTIIDSWTKEVDKDTELKALIDHKKWDEMVVLAKELASGDSDYARTVILQGVFEEMYNRKFVPLQGQALKLLEEYALKGNSEAFRIMRLKIKIPPISSIARKPEIIEAANKAGIDNGGWEAFVNAH